MTNPGARPEARGDPPRAENEDRPDNWAPLETGGQASGLIALLNLRLAETLDLASQVRQAHWHVRGQNFCGLHRLFAQAYTAIDGHAEMIGERIVQLGSHAEGTVRATAARSRLAEYPCALNDGQGHIQAVCRALTFYRDEIRNMVDEADELDDGESADLFTDILRDLSRWLRVIGAHVHPVT